MPQPTLEVPTLDEIKEVFFDAMLAGWASGALGQNIPGIPGSKEIAFYADDFVVKDVFFTTPHSIKSWGTTTISFQGHPVWIMHYGGWYLKHVIPFLKSCLCTAYEERKFFGGRGKSSPRGEAPEYTNDVDRVSSRFVDFVGRERICDRFGQCQGSHWYRGMSLL